MKTKKGFTLIELLVVIAIIGILAAIVLVSLRGAPGKAKDARIKSALNQARTQAEMLWVDNSSYAGLCNGGTLSATSTIGTIKTDIEGQQGDDGPDIDCYADSSSYCLDALLPGSENYFCVDDDGNAVEVAAAPCTAAGDTCQ